MFSLDDSSRIFRYHHDLIKDHGVGNTLALGWRTSQEQSIRFETLAQIDDLNDRSVLDAGCGHADLYPWLKARFPQMKNYCGVEQIPELVDEAIRRYGHFEDTRFIARSFLRGSLPVSDYVFVCGSLNYGSSKPGAIYDAIVLLFEACSMGLAFNLLKYMPVDSTLVAYNPEDILAFCRTLTANVIYKDGYAPEDFTIFLYK